MILGVVLAYLVIVIFPLVFLKTWIHTLMAERGLLLVLLALACVGEIAVFFVAITRVANYLIAMGYVQ